MGATVGAIANAFFDATGARVREYPMTPDRVRAALKTQQRCDCRTASPRRQRGWLPSAVEVADRQRGAPRSASGQGFSFHHPV
jgi:hypothetical protein